MMGKFGQVLEKIYLKAGFVKEIDSITHHGINLMKE
jgi:hypothetical protein